MPIEQWAPALAAGAFILTLITIAIAGGQSRSGIWMLPASLSAVFFAWSAWAVFSEGLFGFWTEHTRNKWGVQIWFDLLLAAGVAYGLIAADAKKLGMHLFPWAIAIMCTGSVAILAMAARFLFLREKAANA